MPVGRVRGRQKALAEFRRLFEEATEDRPGLRVAIAHADAPEWVDDISALALEARPQAEIELVENLGAVVGTHAGPGRGRLLLVPGRLSVVASRRRRLRGLVVLVASRASSSSVGRRRRRSWSSSPAVVVGVVVVAAVNTARGLSLPTGSFVVLGQPEQREVERDPGDRDGGDEKRAEKRPLPRAHAHRLRRARELASCGRDFGRPVAEQDCDGSSFRVDVARAERLRIAVQLDVRSAGRRSHHLEAKPELVRPEVRGRRVRLGRAPRIAEATAPACPEALVQCSTRRPSKLATSPQANTPSCPVRPHASVAIAPLSTSRSEAGSAPIATSSAS